jgi:hypothetical protein
MSHRITLLTCWCLLFCFPVAMMAAEINPAMLSGSGIVKVNDTVVGQSSTVHVGDRVATGKDSAVSLTSKGLVVALSADSAVVYGAKGIEMQYGRATVNAQKAIDAYLGNLTISPAEGNARFQMQQSGSTMTLAALEGRLKVTDGVHQVVLPAGKMMARTPADAATAARPRPDAPPAPQATTGIPLWEILLLAGTAGAGFGLAYGTTQGGGPASPSAR